MPKIAARLRSRRATLTATAAVALLLTGSAAGNALAAPSAERAAERAARAEERATARAERQATRAQEREARIQQRTARREARHAGSHHATSEPPASDEPSASESPTGETSASKAPGTQPSAPEAATPASARGCSATIEASAARIVAGESVTLFGKVSCPGGLADAKRQVITVSEATPAGGGAAARSFDTLAPATPEADGSYQLAPVTPSANTIFRVRVGRHGAHTSVRVAPAVTLSPPAPVALPASIRAHARAAQRNKTTFSGTVSPASAGARVALQVAYATDGEQWRTIAYGEVVEGRYSITHGFRIPGEAKVRVVAHAKGGTAPGVSEAVTYTIPAPQNPQLTLLASANPLSFGEAVTLSGVAAGAVTQPVTLLARTAAGTFAPLATATTDASGNYSFAETPEVDTYYEVGYGSEKSIALFEGVEYGLALTAPQATTAAGAPFTVSGSITPARAGTTVCLERESAAGIGFHVIASGVLGADGTFALAHTFESATNATLRVRVAGDAQNRGSASVPFALAVTPAPAATLTPEAGAEPPAS
ncbi:MAG TPA: hypothetical protein VN817_07835 [Solirubrobacteraceae bacterium]|nr:hypothetical protein [Solirubrobacteraceae bacterium]